MMTLFGLLIAFQIKHLLADYFLQGRYMLGKFNPGWDFFGPLAAHAGTHGSMTLAIVCFFDPGFWWLAAVDLVTHFVIDRVKAGPRWFGRFSDKSKPMYWWILGSDQALHHCVHYGIIAVLLYHFN